MQTNKANVVPVWEAGQKGQFFQSVMDLAGKPEARLRALTVNTADSRPGQKALMPVSSRPTDSWWMVSVPS